MSGNVFSFGNRLASTSATSWYTASVLLGCGNHTNTSDSDILSCMRTKDANDFVNVSSEVQAIVTGSGSSLGVGPEYEGVTGAFGPTIDNITVFSNYTIRGQERQFIQRPILTGNNDDEGCLYAMRGVIPVGDEDALTTAIFTCPTYDTANVRLQAEVPTWRYRWFGESH